MPHFNLRHFMETLGKKRGEGVFVLQIGAMDGKTFDPMHEFIKKYRWSGLLVEPMPEYYAVLQENYQDYPQLVLENIAIAEHTGVTDLHYIPIQHMDEGEVPRWGMGASSFYTDRNALAFKEIEPLIQTKVVACITLPELLEKHKVERIDVLQIDTEGFDYHVLKQLDFERYQPQVINMEIVNLPKSEETLCKRLLDQHGYLYIKAGYDLLAVKANNLA